jgi:hypothetical protein
VTWPRKPTAGGAGGNRLELCQRLIEEARKCLGSGDRECVLRKIEELVRAGCHNGYAVGKEIANGVREIVHELWLRSNSNEVCKILKMFKDTGITKSWLRRAAHTPKQYLDRCLSRCGISWKNKTTRNSVVEYIEGLLRERFSWDENKMCETLLMYIGVDAEVLRRYGIEPCDWVHAGFDEVYFMGIALSDLSIDIIKFKNTKNTKYIRVSLGTTNTVDAVLFLLLLQSIQRPNIKIYLHNRGTVAVEYFIYTRTDKWGWANREELVNRVKALKPEDVPKLIAGMIDGDGTIRYNFANSTPFIAISACKACRKRVFLDALQEVLEKLGIKSKIYETDSDARLEVSRENAIKLLRLIMPYLRHPLKRLRAKLILMLYDGKIDDDTFAELYGQTKYEDESDPKRNHAIDTLARAAPQTHTHGASMT